MNELKMTPEQGIAYQWALTQHYGSVAAQHAKALADYITASRTQPDNPPLTYSIEFTSDELMELRHYLNAVKNNQSLDSDIRMSVFKLLHKFPNVAYAHKPEKDGIER